MNKYLNLKDFRNKLYSEFDNGTLNENKKIIVNNYGLYIDKENSMKEVEIRSLSGAEKYLKNVESFLIKQIRKDLNYVFGSSSKSKRNFIYFSVIINNNINTYELNIAYKKMENYGNNKDKE